jgi:hypothetical protein
MGEIIKLNNCMIKFKDFFSYYEKLKESQKLSDIYSDNDSTFGIWEKELNESVLSEGLITSYPKKKVWEFLEKDGWTIEDKDTNMKSPIRAETNNLNKPMEEMDTVLGTLGYFISSKINDGNYHRITIEQKYPEKIEDKMEHIPYYHVAPSKNVSKILKIGLSPRDSKTTFHHPGNRIYLIQTDDLENVKKLGDILKTNKNMKNPDNHIEEMSILKIDVRGIKLYIDPMFPSSQGTFRACFTTQNIHPKRIETIQ